jgi:hypothetical protein
MKRLPWLSVLIGAAFLAVPTALVSAADPHGDAVLSADKADEDFPFQGEYSGTITRDGEMAKQGVQVIALGDGKFDAVGFHGGLPGDGWEQEEGKTTGTGSRSGNEVVITNPEGNAKAVIRNGRMTIAIDGEQICELQRVERKSPTLGSVLTENSFGSASKRSFLTPSLMGTTWVGRRPEADGSRARVSREDHARHRAIRVKGPTMR